MYASTVEVPVLLVGTAHVVDLSTPLRRLFEGRTPAAIALELDAERAEVLLRQTGPRGPGAAGVPFFLRLWAVLQRRLGEEIGAGAGAEMRAAAEYAREKGIPTFLIDDPIRETLSRLLRGLSVRERFALVFGSLVGLFLPARVVESQIGAYRAEPGAVLEQMRVQFPTVTRVLLDSRNEHMADRLVEIRRHGLLRVAAVVGDAHVPGLAAALGRRGVPSESVRFAALAATAP